MSQAGKSLTRRLLIGLVLVSIAYWTVIASLTIRDSIYEVDELFDVHLAQTALALLRVTDPDESDPVSIAGQSEEQTLSDVFTQWPELPQRMAQARAGLGNPDQPRGVMAPAITGSIFSMYQQYEKNLRYQVWGGDGKLLLRSVNAPAEAMTQKDGYSESGDADGMVWRHYAVWDMHHHFHIVVSEAHDLRNRLMRRISLHMVAPLALGLPVLVLLLWLSIQQALRPLGVLTREIQGRKPDNLVPLDTDAALAEVRPLVLALNELLLRVTDTLEGERRFTSNAAHELRTPLAAIQAQLHVVRNAENAGEREQALGQLQRGIERGIRLVGQMLVLARLDPDQPLPDSVALNLGDIAQTVCADLAPLALQRKQTLELQVEPGLAPLAGNADMLSMLMSNLIDNAIRYTPQGGHIEVRVGSCPTGLRFQVSDDGPGIPADQRERVFDRFYRLDGQDQPGTGLGLAICQRIAELHNARMTLADGLNGRGVSASVLF
jgi:two-component system sensor histidine kinase QseC